MGPYQRTLKEVAIELLDSQVFSGSVDRGSCWRFLGDGSKKPSQKRPGRKREKWIQRIQKGSPPFIRHGFEVLRESRRISAKSMGPQMGPLNSREGVGPLLCLMVQRWVDLI